MKLYVNAGSPAIFDAAVYAVRAVVGQRSVSRTGLDVIEVLDATPEVDAALSRLAAAAGWTVQTAEALDVDREAVAAVLGVSPDLLREVGL